MANALWDKQLAACRDEFPNFNFKIFDSTGLGRFFKKIFPNAGGVTLYNTIWIDRDLVDTERGAQLLSHELAHVRDQHRWTVVFLLTYFLILPIIFSIRAVWEWRGYREDLRWIFQDRDWDDDPQYQAYILDWYCSWVAMQFCGPMYLWMFPFKNFWYRKALRFVSSLR